MRNELKTLIATLTVQLVIQLVLSTIKNYPQPFKTHFTHAQLSHGPL